MVRSRILLLVVTSAVLLTGGAIGATVALAADASGPGNGGQAPRAVTAADPLAPAIMQNTFVPITPCRIIDTRAAGGRIAAGQTRTFLVRGSTGFTAQGGNSGGCGIPASATSVMVSVSSVNIGGAGYFRAWPAGGSIPNATLAHYQIGPITTTGGTMTLGPTGGPADVAIEAFDSPASLVVDVTGYFAPQMAAFVGDSGTLAFATPRVTGASHPETGLYYVTFDTDVSQCSFQVTPYAYNWTVAVGPDSSDPNQADVYIHDQAAPPTPHDTSFFILATC